jgi:SH3-like domain-containing protein
LILEPFWYKSAANMTAQINHQDSHGLHPNGWETRRVLAVCAATAAMVLLLMAIGAAAAERLAVKVPIANVRSGPGTKYEVLWQVERFYPVVVIKKTGQWVLFRDFEKDEGWLKKNLLAKIPTVITVKKECNIRSGPGTNSSILFKTQDRGVPFKVLKRKGKWLYVEHADGDKGWIFKSLVW